MYGQGDPKPEMLRQGWVSTRAYAVLPQPRAGANARTLEPKVLRQGWHRITGQSLQRYRNAACNALRIICSGESPSAAAVLAMRWASLGL